LATIRAAISREARKGIVDSSNDQHRDPRKSRELLSLPRQLGLVKPQAVGFEINCPAQCRQLATVDGWRTRPNGAETSPP